MKNIHKNPILYYIAVPVIVGLWPLLVWAIYLPNAQQDLEKTVTEYNRAEPIMMEILNLDPSLSEAADPNQKTAEFNYDSVVYKVASLCSILPSNCNLNARSSQTNSGKKTQGANVKLTQMSITTFARFLFTIQSQWPNLTCTQVILTAKPGLPNMWDASVEFKYYY